MLFPQWVLPPMDKKEHIQIYYTENEIEIPPGCFSYIMMNVLWGGRLYAINASKSNRQQNAQAFSFYRWMEN